MKIVFVNRFFFPDHSATSQLLSDLAFQLVEYGHRVCVVTSRQRYDDPEARLALRETVQGVKVYRVWTSRFGRHFLPGRAVDYLTFYLSAVIWLWRLARRGDVVVAKTDPPLVSVMAGWVCWLRGAELVNWLQDLFPEVAAELGISGLNGWPGRSLRRLRNASLNRARVNVVLGERMARRLFDEGVPKERIRVIHNWADGAAIRPVSASENPLRAEWGLENRFIVGYSGNLGRAHEFETMLGAIRELRAEEDIVFLFIGGGPKWAAFLEAVARERLGNVQFRPYQPRENLALSLTVPDVHLISLIPALEGLIVPSKFYGVAAAGRPAVFVGDADGEIARILRETNSGVVVEPWDGEGLARAIVRIKDERDLAARMGANARAVFEARFRKGIGLEKWEDVLEDCRAINEQVEGAR